jgi:hypothetical protein
MSENGEGSIAIMPAELHFAFSTVYNACKTNISDFRLDVESVAYKACQFKLNERQIQFRVSKITPTKIGQFVSIWKRNQAGITAPFDATDDLDYIIITAKNRSGFGQFIFPKSILIQKGVISSGNTAGKRGIRVYPPWDLAENKQAIAAQRWQLQYFFTISKGSEEELAHFKKLFY